MKKISAFIIVMTLAIFYTLACHEQGKWLGEQENAPGLTTILLGDQNGQLMSCTRFEYIKYAASQVGEQSEITNSFYDEFTSQVSGKEHRYLNRGITCDEFCTKDLPLNDEIEIVNNTNDPLTNFSGS